MNKRGRDRRKGKGMVNFTNDEPEVAECTMDVEDAVGGMVRCKKCLY